MSRDDFPAKVVQKLGERVGLLCSKPGCHKATKGAHTDDDKVASIGKAAHIHAASPAGPRYDRSQTSDERRSFGNGIWLCSDCAALIDSDDPAYPATLIRQWKADAEARARAALGQPRREEVRGVDSVAASAVRLSGSSQTLRLRSSAGGDVLEALAFSFALKPRLTFDLTNAGRLDARIVDLFVTVEAFDEGAIEDLWLWYGLGRVVRQFHCAIAPRVGRYTCVAAGASTADEYLVLTPGELEAFRVELAIEPRVGVYRLGVVVVCSIAGDRFEKALPVMPLLGAYDPSTHEPVTDHRRWGPPPSCA